MTPDLHANHTAADLLGNAARKIAAVFAVLGAAKRAAAAVELGRRPLARDLRLLGVAPEAFPSV